MFRHVPNLLTGLRLVLAIVFFVMLGFYQYDGRGDRWLLKSAFIVYLIALITDFLDGYLARRWDVEGAFGRVVDPYVDKVLVLGSFVFFAGSNFIIPEHDQLMIGTQKFVVHTISGVTPGIVVLLLARELLVTSLRGIMESSGKNFGAKFSGKVKMVLQSITILAILVYVNYLKWFDEHKILDTATTIRNIFIWTTVAVTIISGLYYLKRGLALFRARAQTEP